MAVTFLRRERSADARSTAGFEMGQCELNHWAIGLDAILELVKSGASARHDPTISLLFEMWDIYTNGYVMTGSCLRNKIY